MKMFTKLALVSSMAISANAMAMQAMDELAMAETTGQDGINIGIGISKISIEKILIHDNDGLDRLLNGGTAQQGNGDGTTGNEAEVRGSLKGTGIAGAIVIKGNGLTGDANKDHGVVITGPKKKEWFTTTGGVDTVVPEGTAGATERTVADGNRMLDSHNLVDLVIDTDAGTGNTGTGASATGTAFLNVAAKVSGLDIYVGEIGVSGSGKFDDGTGAGASNPNHNTIRRGSDENNYNKILSGLTLQTGKMDANIQLGATPQGAMIVLNTTMQGGLTLKNLGIIDNSTAKANTNVAPTASNARAAGEIFLESIKVADASGKDLTVDAKVSVYGKEATGTGTNGAQVGNEHGYLQIVAGGDKATDIYIKGVHLGSQTAGSIGDVEIQGLQTYYGAAGTTKGAVITISGH